MVCVKRFGKRVNISQRRFCELIFYLEEVVAVTLLKLIRDFKKLIDVDSYDRIKYIYV